MRRRKRKSVIRIRRGCTQQSNRGESKSRDGRKSQGWGTMAAVGRRRPPWLAGACILPSFSQLYLGTSRVRCPPTPYPTNNQPPTHPIISDFVNNRRMRMFQVAILLCTCMVGRHLCCVVAQFHHLGVGGAR